MANEAPTAVFVALHAIAWVAGRWLPPPWPWYVGAPLVASGGYVVAVGCGLEDWQASAVLGGLLVLPALLQCFLRCCALGAFWFAVTVHSLGFGLTTFAAAYQASHPGDAVLRWALGLSLTTLVLAAFVIAFACGRTAGPGFEWWSVTLQTSLIGFGLPVRALISLAWLPPFDWWIMLIGGVFGAVRWYWQVYQPAKVQGFSVLDSSAAA